MAKRKPDENINVPANPGKLQDPQPETQFSEAMDSGEGKQSTKGKWAARFGSWNDNQAGVRVIEDRQNRLMTIQFQEKPSESVREVMKSQEHGFRFDPEEQVWYKKINQARPGQSRQEAEQLAFKVANMIRHEKGLEQRETFSVGM